MALPKQEKQGNVVSSKTGIQLQQQWHWLLILSQEAVTGTEHAHKPAHSLEWLPACAVLHEFFAPHK
jgi:hypothetical protein